MTSQRLQKQKVVWLAVQPTPYNLFLYQALQQSEQLDFQFYYSMQQYELLPYEQNALPEGHSFFQKKWGLDGALLRRAFERRSIFVVAGWDEPTKLLTMILRGLLGYPTAFWTDSVDSHKAKKEPYAKQWLKKWLLNHCQVVFTTGDFGVRQLKATGWIRDEQKIASLPYFTPLPLLFKQQNILDNQCLKLLCVARLVSYKGIQVAIEAVGLLRDRGFSAELKVCGIGPDEQVLRKQINELNLEDRVFLIGWKNTADLQALRLEANVLLHTVIEHEPYGLAVMESLAAGLPVVGSPLAGAVVDLVRDGENGWVVDARRPDEIAEKLVRLFEQPGLLTVFSQQARAEMEKWPVVRGLKIIESQFI